jgi:hypothetical protein
MEEEIHEARSTAPNVYKKHSSKIGRILDAELEEMKLKPRVRLLIIADLGRYAIARKRRRPDGPLGTPSYVLGWFSRPFNLASRPLG